MVDADGDQSAAVRGALEPLGHEVIHAATAERAVETLREGGIDTVVVHYTEVRELELLSKGIARLPDPPPMVLTSSQLDAPQQSAHYGAAEFMARPWQRDELVRVIGRVLADRSVGLGPVGEFEDGPTRPNERLSRFR